MPDLPTLTSVSIMIRCLSGKRWYFCSPSGGFGFAFEVTALPLGNDKNVYALRLTFASFNYW